MVSQSCVPVVWISIHTYPKGGDQVLHEVPGAFGVISIHTYPKGGDHTQAHQQLGVSEFQSTPTRREVTEGAVHVMAAVAYFNPHLPEGR